MPWPSFSPLARGGVPLSLHETVGPFQQLPFRRIPGHLDPAVQGPGPAHRRGAVAERSSGSFFIVGDRKQAIYRWRGGNSELMEESRLRKEIPAIDNLSKEHFSSSLGMNWRSRSRDRRLQ